MRRLAVALAAMTMLGLAPAGLGHAGAAPADAGNSTQRLETVGDVNATQASTQGGAAGPPSAQGRSTPSRRSARRASPAATVPSPNPRPLDLVVQHPGVTAFDGMNAKDEIQARADGFVNEPPDQGLCGSPGGLVMETVNDAVAVYRPDSTAALAPTFTNRFFGVSPSAYLTDPRCRFDPETKRWYVTILQIALDGNRAWQLVAVSKSADPTAGYRIFRIDTTDDGTNGTPRHPGCPCYGDFPTLGADANGIFLGTTEFSIHGPEENDAQIYAISKQGLAGAANGAATPTVAHIDAGTDPNGFPTAILQPASVAAGGSSAPGTEYFLSNNDVDFTGFGGGNSIEVYALTNTGSLATAAPSLHLSKDEVASEPYAGPVPARQKAGPVPLGDSVSEPEQPIDPVDDRMQQVELVRGLLVSSLTTGVGPNGTATRDGFAWFVVGPSIVNGKVHGTMVRQGYVNVARQNLVHGSIGLTESGVGVMAFSLAGPDYFPSAAYVDFNLNGPTEPVRIARLGEQPQDGFTCYPEFYPDEVFFGACRFGDYSAAVALNGGTVVWANEYNPQRARTYAANWGTWIARKDAS